MVVGPEEVTRWAMAAATNPGTAGTGAEDAGVTGLALPGARAGPTIPNGDGCGSTTGAVVPGCCPEGAAGAVVGAVAVTGSGSGRATEAGLGDSAGGTGTVTVLDRGNGRG